MTAITVAQHTVADVVDQITIKEQSSGPGLGREMMEKGMKMEGKEHSKEGQHE